jgi:nitrite reductase (NADH) small subunit
MGSDDQPGSPERHVVARADELVPGGRRVVKVGGREIGVFNVAGSFYGVRNVCPHRSGPLCLGRLRPLVEWEGEQTTYQRENEILKCPWHQYEFDLETGACIVDPKLRVRSYRVERDGDDVVLYA